MEKEKTNTEELVEKSEAVPQKEETAGEPLEGAAGEPSEGAAEEAAAEPSEGAAGEAVAKPSEGAAGEAAAEPLEGAAGEAAAETMADYKEELEASFRKISEGDILTGTVIDVSEEGVTLDLRYYAQGFIQAEDMSNVPGFSVMQDVHIGDTVEACVVKTDDGQGNILLSRKDANSILAWDKLKGYMENGTDLTVKVGGVTNGGVIAYVEDIRGFIPASQLSLNYVEDFNPWLGKTLKVRVINVDQGKKKLVLSAKAILKEEAAREHDRKVAMVIPGTVLEGTVESLTQYGAFLNLGDGLSGLVHISQISQKRIKNPSEVLKKGDRVKAKVLNTNNGKISLSMKAVAENTDTGADKIEEFHYQSDGEATTSLGSLFAGLKLDLK